MPHGYPESDWRVFRDLRELALERFCKRVLDGVEAFLLDSEQSHHQRYLALFRWLRDRDDELAFAFNDPKRSQMVRQLGAIRAWGLLTDEEFERFTVGTRDSVEGLAKDLEL